MAALLIIILHNLSLRPPFWGGAPVETESKQQIREKILREIWETYYYLTLSLFSPAIRNRYYLILYTGDPAFYTQPTIPHC